MLGLVGYVFLFETAFFERELLGFLSLVQIEGEGFLCELLVAGIRSWLLFRMRRRKTSLSSFDLLHSRSFSCHSLFLSLITSFYWCLHWPLLDATWRGVDHHGMRRKCQFLLTTISYGMQYENVKCHGVTQTFLISRRKKNQLQAPTPLPETKKRIRIDVACPIHYSASLSHAGTLIARCRRV
jgi:hypothetical protein